MSPDIDPETPEERARRVRREIYESRREEYLTILDGLGFNTAIIPRTMKNRTLLEFCSFMCELHSENRRLEEYLEEEQRTVRYLMNQTLTESDSEWN